MGKFHGVTFCCNACVYASWSNLSERLARSSNGRRRLVPGIVSRKWNEFRKQRAASYRCRAETPLLNLFPG